ncbi:MAG: hypothetical protein FWF05_05970 [Oscillospiraceae bacterium]|nr:hypothetical protein [Oscillospiraceae bacterium]
MKSRLYRLVGRVFTVLPLLFALTFFVYAETEYDCARDIHRYNVTVIRQAEEDTPGERKYVCELCGHNYTEEIPKTGHDFKTERREPACEEDGYEKKICSDCGFILEESFPAIGHAYEGEWFISEEDGGYIYKICANDSSHIIKEPPDALLLLKIEARRVWRRIDLNIADGVLALLCVIALAVFARRIGADREIIRRYRDRGDAA